MREFALPGTRARYAPDRVCAVHHIRLDLAVDLERRSISGRATLTVERLVPGPTRLRLDAVELDVSAVRAGERSLRFRADGRDLWIDLPDGAIGERLDLAIDYGAAPRRGLYFVGPDAGYPDKAPQVWSQGQDEDSRCWFPCVDTPSERATTEIVVTVPAGFDAISNGALIDDRAAPDGRRTLHWRLDVPHASYLVTLVVARLATIEDRAGDVALAYHCAPGREDDCRRTLGRTPAIIDVFARRFGMPYPYPRYSQVFVSDFIFGGMENTTATTLGDVYMLDERAALDFDMDALVAHELAHQWFGDLLTCRRWSEGWLNEGFATYAEYVWREAAEGVDEADVELEAWLHSYLEEDGGRYRRVVSTNVYDEPTDLFDRHLYEKGARVLHMLRAELGEEPYWRAVRHYLEKHRNASVETGDLVRAVEEATGRNLEWFFEQWVTRGAGHPELEVSYAWDAERGLAGVTIRQTQKIEGPTPLFRLTLDVDLTVAGETRRHRFVVGEAQQACHVPCAAEPTMVVVDPGKVLLAVAKVDKPLALWLADLTGAARAIDRREAARQLGKSGGRRATEALIGGLGADPAWNVRGAAAEALGGLRTTAARAALLEALVAERHPKTRRAVVRALGQLRGDEAVAGALRGVVERGDPSYFVEAEACLALGRTRSPQAFDALVLASGRDGFADVVRQHVWRGLAELRDERASPLLAAATRYGRPSQGRRAALMAMADLARGRRDRGASEARERAEELLRDPDFRVQSGAIEALGAIGDPAAIPALEDLVGRALDARLRRRAREVVRDLGEGRVQGEQDSALRDDLDRLRGESARLRERLDQLEAVATAPAPTSRPAGPRRARAAPSPTRRRPATQAKARATPRPRRRG